MILFAACVLSFFPDFFFVHTSRPAPISLPPSKSPTSNPIDLYPPLFIQPSFQRRAPPCSFCVLTLREAQQLYCEDRSWIAKNNQLGVLHFGFLETTCLHIDLHVIFVVKCLTDSEAARRKQKKIMKEIWRNPAGTQGQLILCHSQFSHHHCQSLYAVLTVTRARQQFGETIVLVMTVSIPPPSIFSNSNDAAT